MRFDLTDLGLFVAVVEAGSITHGAARSHLALPSASARLRAMEASLGTSLLARNRNGVTPTAAGDALLRHARLMLRQLRDLQGEMAGHAGGAKGRVRLWANGAASAAHLPDALAPFLARRPDVDIDLHEAPSAAVVNAVASDLADIGILSDTVATGHLHCEPFAVDRLVAVVAKHDVLASAAAVDFATLVERDYIGLGPGSALQAHIEEHAARLGRLLRCRIRMRDFQGVCQMAAHGVGVGIVPQAAAERATDVSALTMLALNEPWATRRLHLCVGDPARLAPYARDLFTHLCASRIDRIDQAALSRDHSNDME